MLPLQDNSPLTLETDASGNGIGAVLSQNNRPIAYFSRTLSHTEKNHSVIEREAMAIIEAVRRWSEYISTYKTIIHTDQRSVAYIFSSARSRIKNEKLCRWKLELSNYNFEVCYKSGSSNIVADTMSRIASISGNKLAILHDSLAHPGITRLWDYVNRHKLPYSLLDVKNVVSSCETCLTCKPKFFKPPKGSKIIRSSRPFERLAMDIVGPKTLSPRHNKYILTLVDEYSRFPFAFPISSITSESVISCLRQLFALFGTPNFIHTDRGLQFVSKEFQDFCTEAGISHSTTTPYHPSSNGQSERYNGIISKAVSCLLHSRKLQACQWESVLPDALAAIRSLLCSATGETPHERMFQYSRKGALGASLPNWLQSGKPAFLKNYVRNKDDPLVVPVSLKEVVNPYYATVEFPNGRRDTVSTSSLAPGAQTEESQSPTSETDSESNDKNIMEEDESNLQIQNNRPVRNRLPPNRFIDSFA